MILTITSYIYWALAILLLIAVKTKNATFLYWTLLPASIFMFLSGLTLVFIVENAFAIFAYGMTGLMGGWITSNIIYEKIKYDKEMAQINENIALLESIYRKKLEEMFWHHRN